MKGIPRKRVSAPLSVTTKVSQPSRDAGAHRGSLAGWHGPQLHSKYAEERERTITQRRTDDLFANDWAARSGIDAIANNSIGTGLVPQSTPPAEMLGISKNAARDLARQMEWYWKLWATQAHHANQMHFSDLQYLGIRTLLKSGEMLHVPIMLSEQERIKDGRTFSFCIQNLAPQRLLTPFDLRTHTQIDDGVHISTTGKPLGYYIALPQQESIGAGGTHVSALPAPFTSQCKYIPAHIGHRKGVFHIFRHDTDEQVRGISPLATGIRLFRHLTDALDYELYAQVIAAAFPVFFASEHPPMGTAVPTVGVTSEDIERTDYQSIEAGTMLYGAPGEKPEILESKRPSQNFTSFVEIIMRAMSASLGIPYESLSKDFSKTNYSSARAALNEAWKMYMFYRKWFARQYCQHVYEMVMEEAFLRGFLVFPKSSKGFGFYTARRLWCSTTWVGPARGSVDPVKEVTATVTALENRLMTYGEAWKERGEDFDEGLEVMREEKERMADLLAAPQKSTQKNSAEEPEDKEQNNEL